MGRSKLWALAAVVAASSCSLREFAIEKTVAEQVNYVPDTEHLGGSELTALNDHVYVWRWTWDRSLVLKTSEGWVIVDPFNAQAATLLKAELEKVAPGLPVHTLIYSHYHLDHVPGGAVLKPKNVMASAKCPAYWADLADDSTTKEILAPTQLIEGDQKLVIGGVELDLIALSRSHTDTLYAFYLPNDRILHTVDFGLVRTLFPQGGPDMYMPGVIKEMTRLSQLDFDTWSPSHFGMGKKQDFIDSLNMAKEARALALAVAHKYGTPSEGSQMVAGFHEIYDPLKAKYGGYHGFQEQSLFLVVRAYSGAFLGY